MARSASSPHKETPVTFINVGTFGVFAAWLAVACFALAYLISH